MLLGNKVATITGAASARGIGKAMAGVFAEQGARVAILDLNAEAAADAARDIGSDHLGLACDVTKKSDCERAASAVLERFGQIDILVNNAGITQPLKIMDIQPANYDAVTDVSLRGTLYMSQAVIPHMRSRKSGSIVCLSSMSAQRDGGIFGGPHYSAAKAGVLGLARAMARELGPDNVRVNSVTPGLIQTDITGDKLTPVEGGNRERHSAESPRQRGRCRKLLPFLASDLPSYLTGVTVDVNGGMVIH